MLSDQTRHNHSEEMHGSKVTVGEKMNITASLPSDFLDKGAKSALLKMRHDNDLTNYNNAITIACFHNNNII